MKRVINSDRRIYKQTRVSLFNGNSCDCCSDNYKKTKAEVIKLLKLKYALEIISEDPLDFKKIEY